MADELRVPTLSLQVRATVPELKVPTLSTQVRLGFAAEIPPTPQGVGDGTVTATHWATFKGEAL